MKIHPGYLLAGLLLLAIGIALGAGATLLWKASNPDNVEQGGAIPLSSSTHEQVAAKISAPADELPADTSGIRWESAPQCGNHPLDVAGWKQFLAAQRAEQSADLVQRAAIQLPAPAEAPATDPSVQLHQALALNVASGRLNRATEIALAQYPDIHTVGDLLARLENETRTIGIQQAGVDAEFLRAVETVLSGDAIIRPVCAQLVTLQDGSRVEELAWSVDGVNARSSGLVTGLTTANAIQANLDSGVASPDGAWAVYTSLGWDEGGPIFLQNLKSGAWTNLIDAMNAQRTKEQPELDASDWWAVIDWFPDSRRLLVGRSDTSAVFVVDRDAFTYQTYSFAGEGNGGPTVVDLAPDGSRFVYLGFDAEGGQAINTFDFASGQATLLLSQPAGSGALYFPRYSPDGSQIAYLLQTGDPLTGVSYAIHLLSPQDGSTTPFIPGNVGLTVPAWSPDGQYIAFTRPDSGSPFVVTPGEALPEENTNIWIAPVSGGDPQQVTFAQGTVRSPVWSSDGRTMAFITQDGQVGLTSLDYPGRAWQAEPASPAFPLLTGAFFIP